MISKTSGTLAGILLLLVMASTAVAQFGAMPLPAARRATVSAELNTTAVQPGQQAVLAVVVDIAPGYHAQSHTPTEEFYIAFNVTVDSNDLIESFAPAYPTGTDHVYPMIGKLNVYDGKVVTHIPLQVKSNVATGPTRITGSVRFQICDDTSCFEPETRPFGIDVGIVPAGQPIEPNRADLFATFDPSVFSRLTPADADSSVASDSQATTLFGLKLHKDAYLLPFAGAFLIGIIFNIVPCVLPVLPLKALGFYEVAQHNRAKCLALGAVFSLGIIATFGALAIPVLVLRTLQWGELFGNPIFAGAITLVLVAMGIGMFGAFGVGLPQWVYRLTPRHDTYSGNFLFGILAAVLSTPCTFGLFFVLLVWAALQPAAVGVGLMMVVGAGMASPYLLLSAFPELARNMPRTGPWSQVVKQMMGFLLLATAVYFAQIFFPPALRGAMAWWMIFTLIAAAGAFLVIRAIQLAPRAAPIAIASAIALLLVGPALAVTLKLANPPMQWTYYSEQSLADARASGHPVIVKFTAAWCANCHTVEAYVFGDEATVKSLRQHDVVAIKADLTHSSAEGWNLLRALHPVGAIPFTAVYLPGEDAPRTLVGMYSSQDLLAAIAPTTTAAR